jgi:hypothetical protein
MLDVEYERVAARQKTSDVTRRSSACGVLGRRKCTKSSCADGIGIGSCARTTNTTATVSASAASIAAANPSSRQKRRRWRASTCCRPPSRTSIPGDVGVPFGPSPLPDDDAPPERIAPRGVLVLRGASLVAGWVTEALPNGAKRVSRSLAP